MSQDGTLTVVTSLPGPGFWDGSATTRNEITAGFEYCMAKAIQAGVGAENLKVRNESFDAIVAGTVTDYDIALSQVTITDERKQVVDFTEPVLRVASRACWPRPAPRSRRSRRPRSSSGACRPAPPASASCSTIVKPDSEAAVYQDLAAAYTALDAGQVDAVLIDTAINLGQAAASDGDARGGRAVRAAEWPDQYGAIVPKGSANLAVFDEILAAMEADGPADRVRRPTSAAPSTSR